MHVSSLFLHDKWYLKGYSYPYMQKKRFWPTSFLENGFLRIRQLSGKLITLNLTVKDDIYDMYVNCVIIIQILFK